MGSEMCIRDRARVLVQMGSKGAQKMQNHTEKVSKPLNISYSDTTKNMFGVGFSRGKPNARSELS